MDVQRRWLCALLTSSRYVLHNVDIMVLQGLLQNKILNKLQFEFVEFSWKQSSKLVYELKNKL